MRCEYCRRDIPDRAKFCPFCNTPVRRAELSATAPPASVGKKKAGANVVLILIMLMLVVVFALLLLLFFSDVFKSGNKSDAESSLSAGREDDDEEEEEEDSTEPEGVDEALYLELEDAVQEYIAESITYEEAAAIMADLKAEEQDAAFQSLVADSEERITVIYESRQQFLAAEEAREEGSYQTALNAYAQVSAEDSVYYAQAQEAIEETLEEFKTSYLEEAEELVQQSEYQTAINVLAEAELAFADEEDFLEESAAAREDCLTAWLEEETGRGHYFGENGAVKIAEQINAQFPDTMTQTDVSQVILDGEAYESEQLYEQICIQRSARGVSSISYDTALEEIADIRASQLLSYGDVDAVEEPTDLLTSYGVSYGWWCATKLLGDSYTSAVEVMDLWYSQQEQNYEYEDACTALGVGISYDADTGMLAWYILTIV